MLEFGVPGQIPFLLRVRRAGTRFPPHVLASSVRGVVASCASLAVS